MPPPPAGPSGPAGKRPAPRSETSMPARLVILAALLFALVLPAGASAHARLQSTTPPAGAALDRAHAAVTVRFDEAVESAFGALTVTDANGERVDDGRLTRPAGNGSAVSVALRRGLRDGAYTADYRVVSDDGHPVAGAFVFRVGPGGPSPAATVARPAQTPPVAQLYDMNRTGGYLALALGIGTLLFLLACWQPALREASGPEPRWRDAADAFAGRWRVLWVASVALGAVTAALGVVLQAATAAGVSLSAALDPAVLHDVLDTRAGRGWIARLVGWLLVAGVVEVAARRRHAVPRIHRVALGADGFAVAGPPRAAVAAIGAAAALLVATPALTGHAAAQSPAALLPLDVVHVAAMCAWLGGLASIAL